jgi:hypothetical protein
MLITMWILAGVFGLTSTLLLIKFLTSSLNALEVFIFLFSIVIFAFAAGMLYDGVVPFGTVIDVG